MDVERLADLLANHHEGTKLFPYTDTTGNLTIGIGHNLTAKGITANQAAQILYDDINDTTIFLDNYLAWWRDLDDIRQLALADMAFDLMSRILEFKNMLSALQKQDWATASTELLASKFAEQTGRRAQDLAHMFLTGT